MDNFQTFFTENLPVLAHPELLPLRQSPPPWAFPEHAQQNALSTGQQACHYCGLGDSLQADLRVSPTQGCEKLQMSRKQSILPFGMHLQPSILDITGQRVSLSYSAALERLALLLLDHRPAQAQTLIYTSGQVDYFALFAMHEVFRLLGVRSIASNAEHGYWSGALYQEFLTGQARPFIQYDQAVNGPNRLFLLSGWNGLVSHPPLFEALMQQEPDLYLIEVMVTETAKKIMSELGPERVLFIRPGSDSLLALCLAHEILTHYPQAIDHAFVKHFADAASFENYLAFARQERFHPEQIVPLIASEYAHREKLLRAVRHLASHLASPDTVPVHIPSLGLSQTAGIVPHCLWANLLACLGKFGLNPQGELLGGVLQVPGQSNEESVIQMLSSTHFPGRIPFDQAGAEDAARRVNLPPDVYDRALACNPRSALDFSEPQPRRELFLFFGTRFERMMMNSTRWQRKLLDPLVQFVVIDPFPDAFSLKHAALVIPTAPPSAAFRLSQSGEWRLNLSWPRHQSPAQMRSDVTLIYDTITMVMRLLQRDTALGLRHPDLSRLMQSGYLQNRFAPPEMGGRLMRQEGEVNRAQLWDRIQAYWTGQTGQNTLFCRPENKEGKLVSWLELLEQGSLIHGGVGSTLYRLDPQNADLPFASVKGERRRFEFFLPQEHEIQPSSGIVLITGRSHLSEQEVDLRWRQDAFNSCKTSPTAHRPQETLAHISLGLAERLDLKPYDRVWLTNRDTRESLVVKVIPSKRVNGENIYLSIHPTWEDEQKQRSLNQLTSHLGRCQYTGQTALKLTRVTIEKLESEN